MSVYHLHRTGILEQHRGNQGGGGGGASVQAFTSFREAASYSEAMVADMTATDAVGNVYTSANAMSVGQKDMSLTKYAPDGTLAWRYSYPHVSGTAAGPENYRNRVADMKIDPSGNVFVCYVDTGTSNPRNSTGGEGQYRVTVIKFNSDGDIVWQRTIQDEPTARVFYFGSMTVDASGNVIVLFGGKLAAEVAGLDPPEPGGTSTFSNTAINCYVVKYSSAGTKVFEKGYAAFREVSGFFEFRSDIITDATGNIYAQWMHWNNGQVYSTKWGPTGTLIWETRYQSNVDPFMDGFAEVAGLGISADGSTLIRGYSYFNNSDRSILLKCSTSTGAIIEKRTIVGPGLPVFSRIYDVKIDPATDLVYIFGTKEPEIYTYSNHQPFLLVMDLNFNIQYFHNYDITPIGYTSTFIGDDATYTNRGPRISIGTDNIALAFLHDDLTAVNGIVLNFNKDGSGISTGTFATSGRGVVYSISTTGAPTFGAVGVVDDSAAPISYGVNDQGILYDITGDITVAETGVTTFGGKVVLTLAAPTLTLL
jgi:hypothetical protein